MQDQDTMGRPASSSIGGSASTRGAGTVAGDAKEAIGREMQDAKQRLAGAADELRHGATGSVSGLVSEQAERRKDEAAEGLRSFAQSVREAADELGKRDNSTAARFVQEAAHGLERMSDGMQSRSIADMMRSFSAFGRENPATFIAGCLIAGVAAGRFLIASGGHDDRDYGSSGSGEAWRENDQGSAYPGGSGYGAADPSRGMASGVGASGDDFARTGMAAGAAAGMGGATPRFGDNAHAAGYDASRQAGAFGGPISPSSAERAPGDNDAHGTSTDDPEPSFPSDNALGEKPTASLGQTSGGRDGDL